MTWVLTATAAAVVIGGTMSANAQKDAANTAANAEIKASEMSVEEQRRQFDAIQELLSPYVNAGETALTQQMKLLGIGEDGFQGQREAIRSIEKSPEFEALARQGETGILQNLSAMGGLRGGSAKQAIAEYRPNLLSGLINQQYNRLGGLSTMGQASAAGVGSAGQNTANQVSNAYQQQGAARANAALASGQATANQYMAPFNALALYGGLSGKF